MPHDGPFQPTRSPRSPRDGGPKDNRWPIGRALVILAVLSLTTWAAIGVALGLAV